MGSWGEESLGSSLATFFLERPGRKPNRRVLLAWSSSAGVKADEVAEPTIFFRICEEETVRRISLELVGDESGEKSGLTPAHSARAS